MLGTNLLLGLTSAMPSASTPNIVPRDSQDPAALRTVLNEVPHIETDR